MTRLKNFDWEAIAGVIAATLALLLHLLHVADQGVLLAVALVILALILLRDLRREDRDEKSLAAVESNQQALREIRTLLKIPDTLLIGPRSLRSESERFAHGARGEMVWFNVCLLMFIPQSLFDALLLPALTNPRVTSIQFILAGCGKT